MSSTDIETERRDFELLDKKDLPAVKRLKERYYGSFSQGYDPVIRKLLCKHFHVRIQEAFLSRPDEESSAVLHILLSISEPPPYEFCDNQITLLGREGISMELRLMCARYLSKFLPGHPDFSQLIAPRTYLERALAFYGEKSDEFANLVRRTIKAINKHRDEEHESHSFCGHE